MTKLHDVYKCLVCGNMVVMVHEGKGELVCCGQPMRLMDERTADGAKEKHVPVVTRDGDKVTVRVGSVDHPMTEQHFIEWIDVTVGARSYRQFLASGQMPIAEFVVDSDDAVIARAYCNLHGLWKSG